VISQSLRKTNQASVESSSNSSTWSVAGLVAMMIVAAEETGIKRAEIEIAEKTLTHEEVVTVTRTTQGDGIVI